MGEMDLTVFCVCVGDKYNPGYVYALQEAVAKNLSIEHEFKCITPYKLPGVYTVRPFVPYQGWWSKINLWAPTIATGPSIYFDLDVVITGSLDYLVDFTEHEFAAAANWARSGYGGIQSSVMAWNGNYTEPYDRIRDLWKDRKDLPSGHTEIDGKPYWGDQEWLWEIRGDDWVAIPGIGSYKYHVRQTQMIPDWMHVCVFHGRPDPHEVNDACLSPYISTLRSHIKSNMENGSERALSATG